MEAAKKRNQELLNNQRGEVSCHRRHADITYHHHPHPDGKLASYKSQYEVLEQPLSLRVLTAATACECATEADFPANRSDGTRAQANGPSAAGQARHRCNEGKNKHL